MKKWNIVAVAAALGLAGATCDGVHAAEKLKVGFVYFGPIGDLGWTYQHDLGRKAMEKAVGDKVETTYIENIPESADAERVMEQLVHTGHKLIFSTSFGYMDFTLNVANKYPNVFFENCAGYKRAKNMSSYDRRDYEGRYVTGQIAAKMTNTGVLGYIVPFPIPPVISSINAMMLGAQSVRPDIKVKIIWVNTWFDPGKEADAAKVLVDQGADILIQHTDSPAPTQIAEQRGVHSFGADTDMIKFGPHAQLTSETDSWGGYYARRAQAVLDGTWKSEDTYGGLDSGMVAMAPYTNMPDDVKKMATDTEAAIASGKLNVFKCPITNQDGKTVECKGGDHLDVAQVRSMNWYVNGIDDKLPAQ
jgi:basic membrane protein A and related proteins